MKLFRFLALAAIAFASFAATQVSANFTDPSFESPLTFDGPPFVGFWEGFQGGGIASSANSTVMPHSGAGHVDLSINSANAFAGVFQDIPGLSPGTMQTFSGWHKTPSSPLDVGVEIRIEWRNSVSDTEISRTPNFTPVPSSDYTQFALTAEVPAGVDTARAVYAIQTFSTSPLGSGSVYIDDFSLQVPEPAALTLLGLGGLAVVGLRRRRT